MVDVFARQTPMHAADNLSLFPEFFLLFIALSSFEKVLIFYLELSTILVSEIVSVLHFSL